MLSRRPLFLAIFTVLFSIALQAQAEGPQVAKGRTVLSVESAISTHNRSKATDFDMAMLQALPQHSFTTRTPWYDRPVKFTGPLLSDVLAAAGVQGQTVLATALNDYTIRIPVADATAHRVIVARLLDDQPMPVRDKGPLFVVYPFDSKAELRSSTYYERSIWQLRKLVIE